MIDADGRVVNPSLPRLSHSAFADVPRTEVMFADTSDRPGPFGAKSMSESPYNPVAAALANAVCGCDRHPFLSLCPSNPTASSAPCGKIRPRRWNRIDGRLPLPPLDHDEAFMRRSFEVAQRARTHGNHPFGACWLMGRRGTDGSPRTATCPITT